MKCHLCYAEDDPENRIEVVECTLCGKPVCAGDYHGKCVKIHVDVGLALKKLETESPEATP